MYEPENIHPKCSLGWCVTWRKKVYRVLRVTDGLFSQFADNWLHYAELAIAKWPSEGHDTAAEYASDGNPRWWVGVYHATGLETAVLNPRYERYVSKAESENNMETSYLKDASNFPSGTMCCRNIYCNTASAWKKKLFFPKNVRYHYETDAIRVKIPCGNIELTYLNVHETFLPKFAYLLMLLIHLLTT